MLGFAGWYSVQPYRDILFYLPLQQTLLIGPVVYYYTKSLLNPSFIFTKKQGLHLAPALIYLIYSLIIFITDKMVLGSYFFYANGKDKDFETWYQIVGMTSMIVYAIFSLRYYLLYKKFVFQYVSFANDSQLKWVRNCLFVFIVMLFLQLVFFVLFPYWGSFIQKWWYYLFFSLLFYYIGFNGFIENVKGSVPFYLYKLPDKTILELPYVAPLTLENKPFEPLKINFENDELSIGNDDLLQSWKHNLEALVLNEKLYENPRLTLLDIAQLLKTHPTLISKMVNKCFNMINNTLDNLNNKFIEIMFNYLRINNI
jgi:hypothetical protein